MRRLLIFLFLAILSVAGCATTQTPQTTQQEKYEVPYFIKARPIRRNFDKLCACYGIDNARIRSVKNDIPAAWATEDDVYITEGICLRLDDKSLAVVMAHELAHIRLGHLKKQEEKSSEISNVMSGIGTIIPGMSLLNLVVNPAIMKQYTKDQEWEADDLASETAEKCLGITREEQAQAYEKLIDVGSEGGGFWDSHPAFQERIDRIRNGPPH
jgi:Zn-dependent protease with chaperone function